MRKSLNTSCLTAPFRQGGMIAWLRRRADWLLWRALSAVSMCLVLAACDSGPLSTQLGIEPVKGYVDLSHVLTVNWNRACVLGPYSTNRDARDILGMDVNIQTRSSIYHSDSYALIVTMADGAVTGLYDVYRKPSDFSKMHGGCFKRDDALFLVADTGHPFASHVPWQQRPPDL